MKHHFSPRTMKPALESSVLKVKIVVERNSAILFVSIGIIPEIRVSCSPAENGASSQMAGVKRRNSLP